MKITLVALYDAWFKEAPDLLAYFPSNGVTRDAITPLIQQALQDIRYGRLH